MNIKNTLWKWRFICHLILMICGLLSLKFFYFLKICLHSKFSWGLGLYRFVCVRIFLALGVVLFNIKFLGLISRGFLIRDENVISFIRLVKLLFFFGKFIILSLQHHLLLRKLFQITPNIFKFLVKIPIKRLMPQHLLLFYFLFDPSNEKILLKLCFVLHFVTFNIFLIWSLIWTIRFQNLSLFWWRSNYIFVLRGEYEKPTVVVRLFFGFCRL